MRLIATAQVVSAAPPASFEDPWVRTERLFLGKVRTTYVVVPAAEGSRVTAQVRVHGVLQGIWALALGPRIAAGLPGALAREVRAAEAEAEAAATG